MRNGNLLIDMHVHLARYEVLSDSTREWFISLYPSEAAYQAVCDANASPEDFCAMLAEKGVDYAKPEDIIKDPYVLDFLGL